MNALLGSVDVLSKLLSDVAWLKWPVALVIGALSFLFPTEAIQTSAAIVGGSIFIDTLTGMRAAQLTGEAIKSRKFSRLIDKGIAYGSFLYLAASLSSFVQSLQPFEEASITTALTAIFVNEGISILENIRRMGFELNGGLDKWFRERLLGNPGVRFVDSIDGHDVVVAVTKKEDLHA